MFEQNSGWLFAGGAAIGTILASFWSHLRDAYQQIASRVVMTITLDGYQAEAMLCYLKSRFRASRWGPRAYMGWMLYVKPESRVQLVAMEVNPPAGRLYWDGLKPLWSCRAERSEPNLEEGINAHDYYQQGITVTFVRGMFDADRLVAASTEFFNLQLAENCETGGRRHYIKHVFGTAGKIKLQSARKHVRSAPTSNTDIRGCLPYRPLHWSFRELGPDRRTTGKSVNSLALSDAALRLAEEAERWKGSEHWFKARNVPWRRGWLLHGSPGTGKTAFARAVAEDLDLPVFVYNLASLHNHELQQAWSKMLAEAPCMALLEDIDAVFDGRKNVSNWEGQPLTFDCLLNCIDGVERADGLFVVVTTNHLHKIDAALGLPTESERSTRPGRVDRILRFDPLDEKGRLKIASRILPDQPGQWELLVREGQGETGAQFQERCAQLTLRLRFEQPIHEPPLTLSAEYFELSSSS